MSGPLLENPLEDDSLAEGSERKRSRARSGFLRFLWFLIDNPIFSFPAILHPNKNWSLIDRFFYSERNPYYLQQIYQLALAGSLLVNLIAERLLLPTPIRYIGYPFVIIIRAVEFLYNFSGIVRRWSKLKAKPQDFFYIAVPVLVIGVFVTILLLGLFFYLSPALITLYALWDVAYSTTTCGGKTSRIAYKAFRKQPINKVDKADIVTDFIELTFFYVPIFVVTFLFFFVPIAHYPALGCMIALALLSVLFFIIKGGIVKPWMNRQGGYETVGTEVVEEEPNVLQIRRSPSPKLREEESTETALKKSGKLLLLEELSFPKHLDQSIITHDQGWNDTDDYDDNDTASLLTDTDTSSDNDAFQHEQRHYSTETIEEELPSRPSPIGVKPRDLVGERQERKVRTKDDENQEKPPEELQFGSFH